MYALHSKIYSVRLCDGATSSFRFRSDWCAFRSPLATVFALHSKIYSERRCDRPRHYLQGRMPENGFCLIGQRLRLCARRLRCCCWKLCAFHCVNHPRSPVVGATGGRADVPQDHKELAVPEQAQREAVQARCGRRLIGRSGYRRAGRLSKLPCSPH